MMSGSQIAAMSAAAARHSAREGILPLLVEAEDLIADVTLKRHLRGIPFIGDRRPCVFKLVNASTLLGSDRGCVPYRPDEPKEHYAYIEVDSSGFGAPGEIAMTGDEFFAAVRKIGPGYAYATVEQGQFQVVVGVFKPRGA
jgi:hypothetical protein